MVRRGDGRPGSAGLVRSEDVMGAKNGQQGRDVVARGGVDAGLFARANEHGSSGVLAVDDAPFHGANATRKGAR